MTDELRAKMERLRAVAPRLNETTAEAGKLVQAVEEFLEEIRIGIDATAGPFDWADEKDNDAGVERNTRSFLAYGRVGGKFRIHVLETTRERPIGSDPYDWDDTGRDVTPWPSCPREVKLRAFTALPELLDNIAAEAERLAAEAEKTSGQVADLLATLREGGAADPAPRPESDRSQRLRELERAVDVAQATGLVVDAIGVGDGKLARVVADGGSWSGDEYHAAEAELKAEGRRVWSTDVIERLKKKAVDSPAETATPVRKRKGR